MAKNFDVIERAKLVRKYEASLKRDIEELYSAMMVVLHRNGNSQEDCIEIIGQIQKLWTELANDPNQNMVELCIRETGFNICEVE